ncbi:ABC transporter substrate-binding protein [Sorangium sp. So ce385]|uniref:ABC transporter substrate-binding protein n=1 Tax=Sorangium sp. So ce385 TaxID=3133308 RepID=UPI003F5C8E1E
MRIGSIPMLVAALAACSSGEEPGAKGILQLGGVVDRTGDIANPNWYSAIVMAQDQMNHALERAGYKDLAFEFPLRDSKNTRSLAISLAQELVAGGAKALVLDSSPNTEGVASLNYDPDPARRMGVPSVSMAASSPFLNNPDDQSADPLVRAARRDADGWVFRTSMSALPQTRVVMNILTRRDIADEEQLKISVLGPKNAFGVGYVSALAGAAKDVRPPGAPAPIVEGIFYVPSGAGGVPTDYNFADELNRLVDDITELTDEDGDKIGEATHRSPPDAIIDASNSGHNINVTKNYSGAIPLLHHDTFRRAQVIEGLGSAADGQEGTSPVLFEPGPSGEAFVRALERVGAFELGAFDAVAYDAAAVLMLASLVASAPLEDPTAVTPAQIRDALTKINEPSGEVVRPGDDGFTRAISLIAEGRPINYEGASGSCDFDAEGNVLMKVAHWKIEQRMFRDLAVFDCVQPTCPLVPDP